MICKTFQYSVFLKSLLFFSGKIATHLNGAIIETSPEFRESKRMGSMADAIFWRVSCDKSVGQDDQMYKLLFEVLILEKKFKN